jgi:glycolate oxidase iron-sulfur subunit
MPSDERLLLEADRCVKCGLCLPACPTYRLAGVEAESPRGRIALVQGLLQGGLPATARLEDHLDACLGCRACEAVCPSGVRYGALIDGARSRLRRPRRLSRRLVLALASRPRWFAAAAALARRLGLRRLGPALPAAPRRWLRLVPGQAPPAPATLSLEPDGAARGRVGLFLGCVGRSADAGVHRAAARLLAALGYAVVCPAGQGCCGAMHQHAGLPDQARRLAARNRQAFGEGLDALLSSATGCGAALREHDEWLGQGEGPPARDLTAFLAAADWSGLSPRTGPRRVAVHLPCSARDAGLGAAEVLGLLGRIPGLEAVALDPALGCCGAAGTYLLHHPATADALREGLLDAVAATGAEVLVTANTGCAMHLRAGLAARGMTVRVAHPAELLAEACLGR